MVVTPIDALGYWEVVSLVPSWPLVWVHHGRCAMTHGTWYDIDSENMKDNMNNAFIYEKK